MKVVILNTSERTGGAAVAANRLLKALHKAGVNTNMLVQEKKTDHPDVESVTVSWWKRKVSRFRFLWERFIIYLCNKGDRKNLFQVSIANVGKDLSKHPLVREADIIHLHWVNQGLVSLSDIKRLIVLGKPIVWTLHDLWPSTGICHYPGNCKRYEAECYDCPMLVDHPLWDLAKQVYRKKERIGLQKVCFVGCSRWITAETQKSHLIKEAIFHSIPNPIDITLFAPLDKNAARESLGLLPDRKYLLFAAVKVSDERKGAAYFIEACRILSSKYADLEILLMGKGSVELISELPFPVKEMGYITDEKKIIRVYSSADLFVVPSLEDNLPNTIMEAMACGTPCVGFHTGGIPEMIDHKANGYIASYKDAEDLAEGIEWVLTQEETNLSEASRQKVCDSYREEIISEKYISLYKDLLKK